jgi:hypothetical protein
MGLNSEPRKTIAISPSQAAEPITSAPSLPLDLMYTIIKKSEPQEEEKVPNVKDIPKTKATTPSTPQIARPPSPIRQKYFKKEGTDVTKREPTNIARKAVQSPLDVEKLQLKAENLLTTIQNEMTKDIQAPPPNVTEISSVLEKPKSASSSMDFFTSSSFLDDPSSDLASFEKDLLSLMGDFGLK